MHDNEILEIVSRALAEDIGEGDITSVSTIPTTATANAVIMAKETGILAGTQPATLAFLIVDPDIVVNWTSADGDRVFDRDVLGHVTGSARSILTAERVVLNILQRMGGIATATRQMVELAAPYGTRILDTRKTAPGLRVLDKQAVRAGGGVNHRMGLYDMVLIKNNHISVAGSIESALTAVTEYLDATQKHNTEIEIEARSLSEVREVMNIWQQTRRVNRILLDNMAKRVDVDAVDTTMLEEALSIVGGRIATEASGNVTLATVEAIAATGVDYISSGSLTHSVRALDISLYADVRT